MYYVKNRTLLGLTTETVCVHWAGFDVQGLEVWPDEVLMVVVLARLNDFLLSAVDGWELQVRRS